MPNALIVVSRSKNNIHIPAAKYVASQLEGKGYKVSYVNMMATDDANVLKYHMQQAEPELLVTFDCAGFELELLGGDLFYNSLCCRAAHILFTNPHEYSDYLNKRMNFPMEFYVVSQEYVRIIEDNYKRVPKVHLINIPELVDANRLSRPLGIFLEGSVEDGGNASTIRLQIADFLIQNRIPFVVCGAGYGEKLHSDLANALGDVEPDGETLIQILKSSAVVIEVGVEGIMSFCNLASRAAGTKCLTVDNWNPAVFSQKLISMLG